MNEGSNPQAGIASPNRRGRVSRWLWVLLALQACCCLWVPFQWGYEAWELRSFQRFIEAKGLPGQVVAVDGRNDWNDNSNGANVRVYWTILARDKAEVEVFAEKVRRSTFPHDLRVQVWELTTGPGDFVEQGTGAEGLFVIRAWYVRPNHAWEMGD